MVAVFESVPSTMHWTGALRPVSRPLAKSLGSTIATIARRVLSASSISRGDSTKPTSEKYGDRSKRLTNSRLACVPLWSQTIIGTSSTSIVSA